MTPRSSEVFCSKTSLNGLKYLVKKDLTKTQRWFFAISIACTLMAALYYTQMLVRKCRNNPVICVMNPNPSFIINEPFPAVTICNMNQAMKSKADKLPKNSKEYAVVQLLCRNSSSPALMQSISDWNIMTQTIVNISQRCSQMLKICSFGGRKIACSHLFHPTITEEGVCCSFNMVHSAFMYRSSQGILNYPAYKWNVLPINWHADAGYPSQLPVYYSPVKAAGIGVGFGLSMLLDLQYEEYYCSSTQSYGFKIALHRPDEIPNVREIGVYIPTGVETRVRIESDKTEAAASLRSVRRDMRKCLFHEESQLKHFAHYTQRNCEMECQSALFMKLCGCLTFAMPRIFDNATVCTGSELKCVSRVMRQNNGTCLAGCVRSCNDITYSAATFEAPLAVNLSRHLANYTQSYARKNLAIVSVYYKNHVMQSKLQNGITDWSSILANIGGLMSLFLGFSLMFPLELFYYAIIYPLFHRPLAATGSGRAKVSRSAQARSKSIVVRVYNTRQTKPKRPLVRRLYKM